MHTEARQDSLRAAIHDNDGDREVTATWLAAHRGDVRVIDVREPHELEGPLGRIEGADNVPLLKLLSGTTPLDGALVLVCRSGRRSSLAVDALRQHGFDAVASLEGGMLAWQVAHGHSDIHDTERAANTHNLAEAVYRTNGLPEVSSQWVSENLGRFRLVDLREPHELASAGRILHAEHVPMGTFVQQAQGLDRSAPLVVLCASGGRSGRIVHALEAAGFQAVASMEGGLFGWRAYGLPVV